MSKNKRPNLDRPENREWIRIAKSLRLLRDQFDVMDHHGEAIHPGVFRSMVEGLRYAASEIVMATTILEKPEYDCPDQFVGQNYDLFEGEDGDDD